MAAAHAQKYTKFWNAFGKALKMGIIEDASNRWARHAGRVVRAGPRLSWHAVHA